LPTSLFILAAFAIFFMVAASWASRRSITAGTRAPKLFGDITDPGNLSVQLPALSAALPFLLLIMVTVRLPLVNPSAVFGLALLLVILLLGMSAILLLDVLPAVGLACALALEHAWHFQHFDPARATGAADLVPRILRGVQHLSLHFPSEVCCENRAVGNGRTGRTVAFLSRV